MSIILDRMSSLERGPGFNWADWIMINGLGFLLLSKDEEMCQIWNREVIHRLTRTFVFGQSAEAALTSAERLSNYTSLNGCWVTEFIPLVLKGTRRLPIKGYISFLLLSDSL